MLGDGARRVSRRAQAHADAGKECESAAARGGRAAQADAPTRTRHERGQAGQLAGAAVAVAHDERPGVHLLLLARLLLLLLRRRRQVTALRARQRRRGALRRLRRHGPARPDAAVRSAVARELSALSGFGAVGAACVMRWRRRRHEVSEEPRGQNSGAARRCVARRCRWTRRPGRRGWGVCAPAQLLAHARNGRRTSSAGIEAPGERAPRRAAAAPPISRAGATTHALPLAACAVAACAAASRASGAEADK